MAIHVAAELGLDVTGRSNSANAKRPCQGPTALRGCEGMTARATGGTSDGQDGSQPNDQRATALRARRLVGRDFEIVEVIERIALTPLTTVTGPGGVGKTALALAVAAAAAPQFPDGVFVVWLASLRSAEHIAGEVAAQVGMPRSGGQSYEDALTQWLAERDVLIVLDNCEHVVSAVADLVEGLTARLPRLRVLATSREPLWALDELSYRLAPLAVVGPDASRVEIDANPAVRLFRERAGTRTQASLDTDHAGRLLGEICRRVDGLPLAIELAAARVVGLDLEDISLHLDDLFDLLPQAARRADGAQRSLRTTVEWSDALLAEEGRSLLENRREPHVCDSHPPHSRPRRLSERRGQGAGRWASSPRCVANPCSY